MERPRIPDDMVGNPELNELGSEIDGALFDLQAIRLDRYLDRGEAHPRALAHYLFRAEDNLRQAAELLGGPVV